MSYEWVNYYKSGELGNLSYGERKIARQAFKKGWEIASSILDRQGIHAFKNDICIFCGGKVEEVVNEPCPKR